MMSLIVAVVRKSAPPADAGLAAAIVAAAFAGASTFPAEHAAATINAPPATHSPQNVIDFMRSTPRTDTPMAELQDGRIAEFIAGSTRVEQVEGLQDDLVRSILPPCHAAILQSI